MKIEFTFSLKGTRYKSYGTCDLEDFDIDEEFWNKMDEETKKELLEDIGKDLLFENVSYSFKIVE